MTEAATALGGLVEASMLFSDIEGSTRLWEDDAVAMAQALELHFDILRRVIRATDGRIIDEAGDGVFAAFATAGGAAAAAASAQRQLHETTWPTARPLRVRMGLHSGSVVPQGPGLTGTQVHRCARLMQTAHGGQIVLSEATAALLRGALPPGVTTRPLGVHQLRDLSDTERVHQLVVEDLPSEFPPLRTPATARHNLPEPLSGFVGREAELRAVHTTLDDARLVTLAGAGGIGKTRLALRVARDRLERHEGGTWLIELATVDEPDDVLAEVLRQLHAPTTRDGDAWHLLVQRLRDQPALLVVDNCEHVVDAISDLLDGLLRSCPDITVLATSRVPLGIDGEVVRRVPSLSVEDGPDAEAVRLFIERARMSNPGWEPSAVDVEDIRAICRRLDGLPLAIELAAARTRALTPTEVRERLETSFSLLTTDSRSAPPRQRTLESAVAWSYSLLEPEEQDALASLSVFVSVFGLDGAEAVLSHVVSAEPIDLVTALVDKSLLQQVRHGRATRYRMLETVRFYGRARLVEAGRADQVARAHLEWATGVAAQADALIMQGEPSRLAAAMDLHVPDMRAAIHYAERAQDIDAGLRLITDLHQFVHLGSHREPLAWLTRFTELAEIHGADPALRSRAHSSLSEIWSFSHDAERALAEATTAIELLDQVDDPLAEGWARHNRAMALWVQGDHQTARNEVEHVLPLFIAARNFPGIGRSLYELALWEVAHGDADAAARYGQRLGEVTTPTGTSPMAAVHALEIDALVAVRRGDLEAATAAIRAAIDVQRELAYGQCAAHLVDHAALVAARRDDHAAAARLLGAAAAVRRDHIGTDVQPFEQVFHDEAVEVARAALGGPEFDRVTAEGAGHTVLSSLALAAESV